MEAKLTKEKREAKAAKFRATMAAKKEAKEKGGYPASFSGEAKQVKEGRHSRSNLSLALELMKLAVKVLEGR